MDNKPIPVSKMDNKPIPVSKMDNKPIQVSKMDNKPIPVSKMDNKPMPLSKMDNKPMPLKKMRDNRSAEKCDQEFHPYTITPETAHTAVLILESKESEPLCMTLRAITRFNAVDMQHRLILFNLDAINKILPHIDHKEINISRFALKALGQLLQLPKGPEQVIPNIMNTRNIAHLFADTKDHVVLEFSALCLGEIAREPVGCEHIVSANIFCSLFRRLQDYTDPDIAKNCLTMITNLLYDPVYSTDLTNSQHFRWSPLITILRSEVENNRDLVLTIFGQLLRRAKDQPVQISFKDSRGLLELFEMLADEDSKSAWTKILEVLRIFVDSEWNAVHLYRSGCLLKLLAFFTDATEPHKAQSLGVLARMSFSEDGRFALFNTSTDLVFCNHLAINAPDLFCDSAIGVFNMMKNEAAANRIADTPIVESLCGIVADENQPWYVTRLYVLKALAEVCSVLPKSAAIAAEGKAMGVLRNTLKKPTAPIEALRLVIQVYIGMQKYATSTRPMLTSDFVNELIGLLQKKDISLKILTCLALSGLMAYDVAQKSFSSGKGESVVHENLPLEHVGLRTALCTLIITGVTTIGAERYIEHGTLHDMIENRQARYKISSWETAIEAILQKNLSAKFSYSGFLDIHEIIGDGFYVLKQCQRRFPTSSELIKQGNNIALVCSLKKQNGSIAPSSNNSSSARASAYGDRAYIIPDDYNIRLYADKVKSWFDDLNANYTEPGATSRKSIMVGYRQKCEKAAFALKKQASILAEFVAVQMSGLTAELDCSKEAVEAYLYELKMELHVPLIGIGWIKCGGALERAVLYKFLADRVELPCSIHRSCSIHAWVQVAIPELEPKDTTNKRVSISDSEGFPDNIKRVNYMVDLIDKIGRMFKVDEQTLHICGADCIEACKAVEPTVPCKCDT